MKSLAESGQNVPFETVRACIGMGGDKLLPKVAGVDAESPEGKAISNRRGQIFLEEHLPGLKPCRGATDLLEDLNERGYRMAAASSAKKGELEPLLQKCGADRVVESATSSDDAENSKPDPDILEAALEKLGMKTEEVVLIGDTPYDIEAAKRANIRVIAFRCGGWSDHELEGAEAVYDDPRDLLDRLKDSPFSERVK